MQGQDGTFPHYGTEYERAGYLDYLKIKPGRPGTAAAALYMETRHHDTPVRPRCGIGWVKGCEPEA